MQRSLYVLGIVGMLCFESIAVGAAEDEDAVLEKIDVEVVPAQEGVVCAFITNNSNTIIDDLEIQVLFKDNDGNTIDLDEDGHDMILPGYTVVSRIDAPNEYASFEPVVDIELGVNPLYENHSENVGIKTNEGENCLILEITNNSEVDIEEIEYNLVCYNDAGEVIYIDYENDVYDVESGKTITEKESVPVEYDRYEVYLNQAHTFGL